VMQGRNISKGSIFICQMTRGTTAHKIFGAAAPLQVLKREVASLSIYEKLSPNILGPLIGYFINYSKLNFAYQVY